MQGTASRKSVLLLAIWTMNWTSTKARDHHSWYDEFSLNRRSAQDARGHQAQNSDLETSPTREERNKFTIKGLIFTLVIIIPMKYFSGLRVTFDNNMALNEGKISSQN